MIGKARHHRRGSVVIMVVGLLTLLAMIGSTLVIVSFVDRREARSIAATVPVKNVAGSLLGRVVARLGKDLYISDNGTPNVASDDVLYGLADTPEKRIDYPSETVDKHLASYDLHYDTATSAYVWKHVSNIPGDLSNATDVSPADPRLADTDTVSYTLEGSEYWGDSLLWDTGMKDRAERHLFGSVRLVDASGLLAVNLAHRPAAAASGKVMPITDLSLVPLLGTDADADAVRDARLDSAYPADTIADYWINYALRPNNVGANRRYYPFTVEDMLATAWLPGPNTGRLYSVLTSTGGFDTARSYVTVASVGRIGIMPDRTKNEQKYKVDLNKADFDTLYNAFYNVLEGVYAEADVADRRRTAGQLAVNAIDFRDVDSDITREKDPNETAVFYGVERQPFIVEAAYKREEVGGNIENYYAIELFNPFRTAVDIRNWQVKVGAAAPVSIPAAAGNTIPPGGRLVIVNDAGIQTVGTEVAMDTLDLTQDVLILRPSVVAGNADYIVVDRVSKADFLDKKFDTDPAAGEKAKIECIRRDDILAKAFYTLPIYNKVKIEDDITVAGNNLGKPNGAVTLSVDDVLPCPVYVRNGNFINVADVCRIFAIGPGDDVSLSDRLAKPTSLYNGRLDMDGTTAAIPPSPGWGTSVPSLPLGCMPWEFLMVQSPMADGVDNDGDGQIDNAGEDLVYGRVNINTAPHDVLQCLPSLARLDPPGDRDKIVRELLCYRDLDDNTDAGAAAPASQYKTSGRETALGIANLRAGPGFASPGEIALPLLARARRDDISAGCKLPSDAYSSNLAPTNYAVSDGATPTDDGLSAAAADTVSGDFVKHQVYASWLSNHVTVRSDVYLAYIAVYGSTVEGSGTTMSVSGTTLTDNTKNWKDGKWVRIREKEEQLHVVVLRDNGDYEIRKITDSSATTLTVAPGFVVTGGSSYQILSVKRRYVALIDRSNVRSVRDRPEVLMFAEMR